MVSLHGRYVGGLGNVAEEEAIYTTAAPASCTWRACSSSRSDVEEMPHYEIYPATVESSASRSTRYQGTRSYPAAPQPHHRELVASTGRISTKSVSSPSSLPIEAEDSLSQRALHGGDNRFETYGTLENPQAALGKLHQLRVQSFGRSKRFIHF